MKKTLLTLVGGLALVASAQQVTVTSNTRLLKGVEGPAYYPVLNSTGSQLLFASGESYGLKMYDFADNVVSRISDEMGAGIDASFSANGDVYYVTQKMGDNRLIYRTGMRYDNATAKSEVVLEAQHGYVRPELGTRANGFKGAKKSFAPAKGLGTAVCVQGSVLYITKNGVTKEYTPVPSYAGYLWASLSHSSLQARASWSPTSTARCFLCSVNMKCHAGTTTTISWLKMPRTTVTSSLLHKSC